MISWLVQGAAIPALALVNADTVIQLTANEMRLVLKKARDRRSAIPVFDFVGFSFSVQTAMI